MPALPMEGSERSAWSVKDRLLRATQSSCEARLGPNLFDSC